MTTPTKEDIASLEGAGLVTVRSHNSLPLRIVNYTPKAQFERAWTPALLQCRGLVYDDRWSLVARPLPKFFNYEEHLGDDPPAGPLPTGPFTVTEKYDGSLGIVFRWNDHVLLCTRGSFHSEQADKGTEILYRMMKEKGWRFPNPDCTHLFEIIYPSNRIVVDYGKEERLQWLTSIDNATGRELYHYKHNYGNITEIVGQWDVDLSPLHLKSHERDNAEGYVLRYTNGQRVKIKFEKYVELHRLVTGLSTTAIWEVMRAGKNPLEVLTALPDELYGWAEEWTCRLREEHQKLVQGAIAKMTEIRDRMEGETRREFAEAAKGHPYPHLLFMALDGDMERLNAAAWKLIEPERSKPTPEEC